MSVFTNPAASAPAQAAAYIAAILDLLGDRDPFEVLARTPTAVREAYDGLTLDQMRQREAPGKWSIVHVLRHLADAELVWGYRVRMILAHERPAISPYDQDLWADRLRYERSDPNLAHEQFRVLREANLALLDTCSVQDRQRVALHAERGEESIDQMIRLNAGHDLLHLRQIARIRAAIGAPV
ncbi:MAG: DinB family protein [Bacteroidales bacterium]